MSRQRAIAALRGAPESGLATGMTWLSADVLESVLGEAGSAGPAIDRAEVATDLEVDLAFVAAAESTAVDEVEALHEADVAAMWALDGVFGRVARVIGWVEALRMSAADPGALAARLDTALHEALLDARAGIAAGADALLVADDLAGPAGPLLSPDYALDALLPCYHRIVLEASAADLPALFHSDGEIRAFIPALAREGFAGVHVAGVEPLSFSANGRAARTVGLVVLGGISAAALPQGARVEGERAAAFTHSFGGAIVCDDGGITAVEQVAALGVALAAARDAHRQLPG